MCRLTEGELEFVFEGAVSARKFDGRDHGLSHCMKAVDFIVEFQNQYLFVEIKDPQNSGATEDRRRKWIEDFTSSRLDQALKYKYRDSFLYEWCAGRGDKLITYVVLIALDSLEPALMGPRQDQLARILPTGAPEPWIRPIVQRCVILNIESWNRTFQDSSVRRRAPDRRRSNGFSP